MMETPKRHAELVLVFRDNVDLAGLQLEPDSARDGNSQRYVATISSGNATGEACDVHLERLWDHAREPLAIVKRSSVSPEYSILRIVQYLGTNDEGPEPGIWISPEWVAVLAEHNGCVDIDQYVE
jgi:hypothetical protein